LLEVVELGQLGAGNDNADAGHHRQHRQADQEDGPAQSPDDAPLAADLLATPRCPALAGGTALGPEATPPRPTGTARTATAAARTTGTTAATVAPAAMRRTAARAGRADAGTAGAVAAAGAVGDPPRATGPPPGGDIAAVPRARVGARDPGACGIAGPHRLRRRAPIGRALRTPPACGGLAGARTRTVRWGLAYRSSHPRRRDYLPAPGGPRRGPATWGFVPPVGRLRS
jgi:hypothetical protein